MRTLRLTPIVTAAILGIGGECTGRHAHAAASIIDDQRAVITIGDPQNGHVITQLSYPSYELNLNPETVSCHDISDRVEILGRSGYSPLSRAHAAAALHASQQLHAIGRKLADDYLPKLPLKERANIASSYEHLQRSAYAVIEQKCQEAGLATHSFTTLGVVRRFERK